MHCYAFFFCLCFGVLARAEKPVNEFALSEHLLAGQEIALLFEAGKPAETNSLLHLPNGLELGYGNILSLGDLCGIEGQPISLGSTVQEQQQRFEEAFDSFAKHVPAVNEIQLLILVIEQELKIVQEGMMQGEIPEAIFSRIGYETGRQINCLTGGGCQSAGWWLFPGRYLKLAMENYDHFAPNSKIAWLSGHQLALLQAFRARKTGQREDLELAYAMDAFACHFLSDQFAAGHLRTPRIQLANHVSPSLLGSLLANYMHNEDNRQGIHVRNRNQEHWVIYGDFSYFNPENQTNRQILGRVLQDSANEIFNTWYTGIYPDSRDILNQIPEVDDPADNISPLFYWDESSQQLLRRADIGNLHAQQFTANWWGWSTLAALQRQYS